MDFLSKNVLQQRTLLKAVLSPSNNNIPSTFHTVQLLIDTPLKNFPPLASGIDVEKNS